MSVKPGVWNLFLVKVPSDDEGKFDWEVRGWTGKKKDTFADGMPWTMTSFTDPKKAPTYAFLEQMNIEHEDELRSAIIRLHNEWVAPITGERIEPEF